MYAGYLRDNQKYLEAVMFFFKADAHIDSLNLFVKIPLAEVSLFETILRESKLNQGEQMEMRKQYAGKVKSFILEPLNQGSRLYLKRVRF